MEGNLLLSNYRCRALCTDRTEWVCINNETRTTLTIQELNSQYVSETPLTAISLYKLSNSNTSSFLVTEHCHAYLSNALYTYMITLRPITAKNQELISLGNSCYIFGRETEIVSKNSYVIFETQLCSVLHI